MSRLAVLYSCDENYARIMAVSIVSLYENNKEIDDVVVSVSYTHLTLPTICSV